MCPLAYIKIEMKIRDTLGTGSARDLRRKGLIPAVLYGEGINPVHLFIDERIVLNSIYQKGFSSKVFNIHFNSRNEKVIVRDIQQHPVSDRPIHVDFMRLSDNKSVLVSIPLNFHGPLLFVFYYIMYITIVLEGGWPIAEENKNTRQANHGKGTKKHLPINTCFLQGWANTKNKTPNKMLAIYSLLANNWVRGTAFLSS